VVFIAGTGRSGSTLLGNAIGSVPGAFAVGEARQIWGRGLRHDWDCGCGARFSTCSFWQEVMRTAFPEGVDIERLLASDRALLRLRASRRATGWSQDPELVPAEHRYYLDSLARLYPAMHMVSGATVLIDSSKTPSYAALLAAAQAVDLRVLHLVRDPRAAAYSWLSPKASPDRRGSERMDRLGAAKSATLWVVWNRAVESLLRAHPDLASVRLTYEDFMAEPRLSLRNAIDRLAPELAGADLPLMGRSIRLVTSHTVSGNADRMRQGEIGLESDERWKQGLRARHQLAVLAIGALSMRRYGYGLRVHG
jgi:hypothetical protein